MTPDLTTLHALRERVEKATGPDRDLDRDIHEAVVGLRMYESFHTRGGDLCLRYYADPTGPSYGHLPRYTASVDADRALVERVLPGWGQASGNVGEDDRPWATITEPTGDCRDFIGSAATEPLANVVAVLTALIERTEGQER